MSVDWFGAAAYANWRSERDGLVPSYDKWGFNATWLSGSEAWYLRLNVTNLTDEEILISAFDFSSASAYVQELYLPPRWVSLSFGVSF